MCRPSSGPAPTKSLYEFPPAAQLAKTTLFASGNEADVGQTRRSAFGRPEVDPKGAVQGGTGTKSAAGDFFQWTKSAGSRLERRGRGGPQGEAQERRVLDAP